MSGDLVIRVFDVEHGACAMLGLPDGGLAMIDAGHNDTTGWRPSEYIRYTLGYRHLDHLFIQNFDNDHLTDLARLDVHGVDVGILHRNPTHSAAALRNMKADGTTPGIDKAIEMVSRYTAPVPVPAVAPPTPWVTYAAFWNQWPWFTDTNDLSLVVFIKYAGFKILFPGDLTKAGWQALLRSPAFRAELYQTDVLVASHHGRQDGFCEEAFQYFTPQLVVMSDGEIKHETQEGMAATYRAKTTDAGVPVIGQKNRYVMSTRDECADIIFRVNAQGRFWISTERSWSPFKVA